MGSKKYKGKQCAYCGDKSTTGDHVVAREFFTEDRRSDLVKVPACVRCNRRKSELEHYAVSILPLGSSHDSSRALIPDHLERRFSHNERFRRELMSGMMRLPEDTGLGSLLFPLREADLSELFGMIGQGLLYHHFGVVLPPECAVRADPLTEIGLATVRDNVFGGGRAPIDCSLANGGFHYMGGQANDNPTASVWLLAPYGGFGMKDKHSDSVAEVFGVFTGPVEIIQGSA